MDKKQKIVQTLNLISSLDMERAFVIAGMQMQMERSKGGVEAMAQDIQRMLDAEHPGQKVNEDAVEMAMTGGFALSLLLMGKTMAQFGLGFADLKSVDAAIEEPADAKQQQEAERLTGDVLSRIRNLH